jgi:CHAT domain-containing protein
VPAVVGSLWPVNDLSTALLMHRFYELHLHGDTTTSLAPQEPARALRLAQVWLRDLTFQAMYAYFERHAALHGAESLAETVERMPGALIDQGLLRAEHGMFTDPAARPFAAPRYWAAFTFNGAMHTMEEAHGR